MAKIARGIAHASVVLLAAVPWVIGCIGFAGAVLLALAADWIMPNAKRGNCWSFALPKWAKQGGYLLIRPADDVRVLGIGIIPHAIWVHELQDGNGLQQSVPLKRSRAKWLPWQTLYFEFVVRSTERPRNAAEQTCDASTPQS